MTDSGNVPELQDLEPLDSGATIHEAAPQQNAGDPALAALRSGLAPPAFNPMCGDKAYYRFLMCSVLMLLGCAMPFSAHLDQVGYKTMSGAFFTFIALGMLWTWWGAIHFGRSSGKSLKWLGLCFIPLVIQAFNLSTYDPQVTLDEAKLIGAVAGNAEISTWATLFQDMLLGVQKKVASAPAAARVENFFRCFGTGKLFVMFGALLAELFFIGSILGGAKQNKVQKAARMAQASERRRR